jgi:succinyl-CoA synthetase alpha subunit
MSIWVNKDTKIIVQGLTGSEGRFHAEKCREYGAQIVAGVTPGKAGQDVDGVPVFNTVEDAVEKTGANCVGDLRAAAVRRGRHPRGGRRRPRAAVCITEGIPARDMVRVQRYSAGTADPPHRPQLPRHHHPGRVQDRHHARQHPQARPVGVVSRSGTLTYEAVGQLTNPRAGPVHLRGHRRRPCPAPTSSTASRPSRRTETEGIVMIGEIGGTAEEEAAEFVTAERLQAGGGLHRRPDGPSGTPHGPRRRDHLRRQGHRGRQDGGAQGRRHRRGSDPGRDRLDHEEPARGRRPGRPSFSDSDRSSDRGSVSKQRRGPARSRKPVTAPGRGVGHGPNPS